jgi:hypothetical protein
MTWKKIAILNIIVTAVLALYVHLLVVYIRIRNIELDKLKRLATGNKIDIVTINKTLGLNGNKVFKDTTKRRDNTNV